MNSIYKIILALLLICSVNAHLLDVNVGDYNTLQPVENATVKVYNGTILITENLTDSNGNVKFDNLTSSNYTIVTTANLYDGDNTDVEVLANQSILILLEPYSFEGIIRVKIVDMLPSSDLRQVCFFYFNNMRLHECYYTNETITLQQHGIYYIRLIQDKYDIVASKRFSTIGRFFSLMPITIILVFLIGILLYIAFKPIRR